MRVEIDVGTITRLKIIEDSFKLLLLDNQNKDYYNINVSNLLVPRYNQK